MLAIAPSIGCADLSAHFKPEIHLAWVQAHCSTVRPSDSIAAMLSKPFYIAMQMSTGGAAGEQAALYTKVSLIDSMHDALYLWSF